MPVEEGFRNIAQDYLSEGIASNFYLRDPLLYAFAGLGAAYGKPTGLEIGRPSGQIIISGTKLTQIERKQLAGINSYKPEFQFQNPTNTKIQGAMDTAPTVANPTTASHDQISGRAEVRWTGLIKEPILVWKSRLDRAVREAGASKMGRGIARATILKRAVNVASQAVWDKLSDELWTGNPTDQDWDPWDHLLGLAQWINSNNVCARVNRSLLRNAQWNANVDATSRAPDIAELAEYVNIDFGIADKVDDGCQICICNNAQYKAYKAQIMGKSGVELLTGLPSMAQYGVKRELLRRDNLYIVRAKKCPANTTYFLTPSVWKFITHPEHSFNVTDFVDLSKYQEGGKEAFQAFAEIQPMLTCDNPGLQCVFTGIQDPT
jgi:hypothetical protein